MATLAPYEYQCRGSAFIQKKKKCYLALSMGAGKTTICLDALCSMLTSGEIIAALIVAPLRVCRLTWPAEIKKWDNFQWLKFRTLHGSEKKANLMLPAHIYLINYEGLPWLCEQDKWPFDALVFDESTKMKSYNSSRFKEMVKRIENFNVRIALSGTPSPNGLLDLWAQYRLIDGGKALGDKYFTYRGRWFENDYMNYNYTPYPHSQKMIERAIAPITFQIEDSEYPETPCGNIIDHDISLPAQALKDYKLMEKKMFIAIDNIDIEVDNAATLSNKCLQYAGGAIYDDTNTQTWHLVHDKKIEELSKIIKIEYGNPILIAYSYRHEADRIRKRFPSVREFSSRTSEKEEKDIMNLWSQRKIPLLMCHPASAGHGLNLQAGNVALWFTLPWNLEYYLQFNARIERAGQTRKTRIYRIIAHQTIESFVAFTLEQKEENQKVILENLRNIGRNV